MGALPASGRGTWQVDQRWGALCCCFPCTLWPFGGCPYRKSPTSLAPGFRAVGSSMDFRPFRLEASPPRACTPQPVKSTALKLPWS